jgi:hypothetical protein
MVGRRVLYELIIIVYLDLQTWFPVSCDVSDK